MPAKRSAMRKIKDVLRLKFEAKLSHERIAAATGMSKGAVTKYVQRALQKGLGWPLPADLDEAALEGLLFRQPAPREHYAQPDFPHVHQELKRKGVTLQLLWEEYHASARGACLPIQPILRALPPVSAAALRARCARCTGPARNCSSTTAATPSR